MFKYYPTFLGPLSKTDYYAQLLENMINRLKTDREKKVLKSKILLNIDIHLYMIN